VNALPQRYRVPFVLCCLEGCTLQEAAAQLGRPPATVGTQVRRARERLRARLLRRGVAPSAGGLAAALAAHAASAHAPPALLARTCQAAGLSGSGRLAAAGAFPARVICLTEGVLRGMWLKKLLPTAAAVLLGLGGTGLAYQGLGHPFGAAPGPARVAAAP